MTGQTMNMPSLPTRPSAYRNEEGINTNQYENHLPKWRKSGINTTSGLGIPETINFPVTTTIPDMQSTKTSRPQMLRHYLVSVRDAGDISAHTSLVAWDEWKLLNLSSGNSLPVPDAAPGPDGQILYVWENKEHYFEAEIFPNDTIEFFYWNRESNEAWEKDCNACEPISQDIVSRLKIFI